MTPKQAYQLGQTLGMQKSAFKLTKPLIDFLSKKLTGWRLGGLVNLLPPKLQRGFNANALVGSLRGPENWLTLGELPRAAATRIARMFMRGGAGRGGFGTGLGFGQKGLTGMSSTPILKALKKNPASDDLAQLASGQLAHLQEAKSKVAEPFRRAVKKIQPTGRGAWY